MSDLPPGWTAEPVEIIPGKDVNGITVKLGAKILSELL